MPTDPRNEEYIDPYDHPSLIPPMANNPEGDPNGDKFKAALKAYLNVPSADRVPLKLLGGRGPGINIPKTLELEVYRDFPYKEKWL